MSRAAATLTASPIAPGTSETHAKLTDPVRRPLESAHPLTAEDRVFEPAEPLFLSQRKFLEDVRSGKRGVAPGRCGTRQKHLRALLEHEKTADALNYFAHQLAKGKVSEELRAGLAVLSITALRKKDSAGQLTDEIRGIATGRRLTARTIA